MVRNFCYEKLPKTHKKQILASSAIPVVKYHPWILNQPSCVLQEFNSTFPLYLRRGA